MFSKLFVCGQRVALAANVSGAVVLVVGTVGGVSSWSWWRGSASRVLGLLRGGSGDLVVQFCRNRISWLLPGLAWAGCPVFWFDYRIEKITSLDGQEEKETSELKGKRLLLSSGIANPQSFSKMLKLEEGCPVAEMRFEDHHNYSESSISNMIEQGNTIPHDFWLTT